MYKLLVVFLLSISLMIPVHGAEIQIAHNAPDTYNKNLAMVGAGMLGILLASGAIGLINSGTMMYEGAGFAEAMEGGAGLSLPMTFLTAVLGAVFAQDFVLRNINNLNLSFMSETVH